MTVLFPSSLETHDTIATQYIRGLFLKVSIERALIMILAFLLASIIFVDLHIFNLRKLVYRNGITNSRSAARRSPEADLPTPDKGKSGDP